MRLDGLLNVTPGVEQLERAGEEVDASASASAILLSIVVQIVIGLLLFALFAFLRPRIPSVYAPVEEFSKRPIIAAREADGGDELERAKCFAWRYNLPWRDESSEQDVLERSGLDALLLLRMMRLCFEASLLATICAGGLQATRAVIGLVVPNPKVHAHHAHASQQHQFGLPLEYNFMVVPCLFVWVLSLCLYALVYFHVRGHAPPCSADAARPRQRWICCRPFRSFVVLRRERLSEARAANFVVLAQDLPTELSTLREARNVFSSLLGDDVESVIPVPAMGEIATRRLDALVQQRFRAVAKLERAIGAVRAEGPASGSARRRAPSAARGGALGSARGETRRARGLALDAGIVGSDSDSDVDPAAVVAALPPPASSLRTVEREFLGDPQVLRLRSLVARLDQRVGEAMVRCEARLGYFDAISLSPSAPRSASSYGSVDDAAGGGGALTPPPVRRRATSPATFRALSTSPLGIARRNSSLVSFRSLAGSTHSGSRRRFASDADEETLALVSEEADRVHYDDGVSSALGESTRIESSPSAANAMPGDGSDTYGDALRLYENRLSSVFIGFRTRAAAAGAVEDQRRCGSAERWISLRAVPDAHELRFGAWSDLARRRCARNTRWIVAQVLTVAVILLWAVPLSIASNTVMHSGPVAKALAYVEGMTKHVGGGGEKGGKRGGPFAEVDTLLNDFLATLALRIFLFVAPIVVRYLVQWEGEVFPSLQEASVLRKWFAFEAFNMFFVLSFSGTIGSTLSELRTSLSSDETLIHRSFHQALHSPTLGVAFGDVRVDKSEINTKLSRDDGPQHGVLQLLLVHFGTAFPRLINFYISYVATYALIFVPFKMLRVGFLWRRGVIAMRRFFRRCGLALCSCSRSYRRRCVCCAHVTPRDVATLMHPSTPLDTYGIGVTYGTTIMILLIVLTYSPYTALVPLFGAIYFGSTHEACKWMLIHVCKPVYDSGGQALWSAALDCVLFAIGTMQIVFIGVLLVRLEESERVEGGLHHGDHGHAAAAAAAREGLTLGGFPLYAYMVPLPIITFLFAVQLKIFWLPEGASLPLDEARRLDGIEVTFDRAESVDKFDVDDEQGGGEKATGRVGRGVQAKAAGYGHRHYQQQQLSGSSALRMECTTDVVASMGALPSMPISDASRPSGITLNLHTVLQPRIDEQRLRAAARAQGPVAAYHVPSLLVQIETKLGTSSALE